MGKYNMPKTYIASNRAGAIVAQADTQAEIAKLLGRRPWEVQKVMSGKAEIMHHPKHGEVRICRVWKPLEENTHSAHRIYDTRPSDAHSCARCCWGSAIPYCDTIFCPFPRCAKEVLA